MQKTQVVVRCRRFGNTLRQRLNIGWMVLFGQAVQITLVVAGVVGFFVGFGFMTMSESTILNWTRLPELTVLATAELDGRELVLTESLLRVSVFLGFFSGMYFTVLLATDLHAIAACDAAQAVACAAGW